MKLSGGREARLKPKKRRGTLIRTMTARDNVFSKAEERKARDDGGMALAALSQFDAAHADFLNTLRSQRAWRVMLMIRKTYTLWKKGTWKSKLDLLKVPLEALLDRPEGLAPYDVVFPSVWDYLPASLTGPSPSVNDAETAGGRREARLIHLGG